MPAADPELLEELDEEELLLDEEDEELLEEELLEELEELLPEAAGKNADSSADFPLSFLFVS